MPAHSILKAGLSKGTVRAISLSHPTAHSAGELARLGFGQATDEQLLSLAMGDTGFAFINELKAQGYDTATVEQLVRMSHHGVRLEYLQGLKSLGLHSQDNRISGPHERSRRDRELHS